MWLRNCKGARQHDKLRKLRRSFDGEQVPILRDGEYKGNGVVADFGKDDWNGTLSVGGNEYSVYIGHIGTKMIDTGCGRTLDGTLVRNRPIIKHKFTLIEM